MKIKKVDINEITMERKRLIEKGKSIKRGRLSLSLEKDMTVLINASSKNK